MAYTTFSPNNHTETGFAYRHAKKRLFIFFTAIRLATLQRAEGEGRLPEGRVQPEALDLLCFTPGCLEAAMKAKHVCFLPVTAFAEARLLGLVSCQDSSAAWEHRRINVTFLHVKDHRLLFTLYSVWSLFMETMAKEEERKRLSGLASSLLTEMWGDASRPT